MLSIGNHRGDLMTLQMGFKNVLLIGTHPIGAESSTS
jgi:hypothetical protein